MGKDIKGSRESSLFAKLFSWFCISSGGENEKSSKGAAAATGPEATMVAAGKHFSTAHKVRLI